MPLKFQSNMYYYYYYYCYYYLSYYITTRQSTTVRTENWVLTFHHVPPASSGQDQPPGATPTSIRNPHLGREGRESQSWISVSIGLRLLPWIFLKPQISSSHYWGGSPYLPRYVPAWFPSWRFGMSGCRTRSQCLTSNQSTAKSGWEAWG